MARQFISSPPKPLRFYLDAGSAEFNATGGAGSIYVGTKFQIQGYGFLAKNWKSGTAAVDDCGVHLRWKLAA
jgi:hypothetical protein